jgi:RNA polymerase sigma-70 factor (ECF subfamily)
MGRVGSHAAHAMPETTAETLLRRLSAGDQQALGEFYDRYAGLVNALALRVLRDVADAEDVVQEVFVQVWRQASRFDPSRGSPEAWLCTVARTRALVVRDRQDMHPNRDDPAPRSPGAARAMRGAPKQ